MPRFEITFKCPEHECGEDFVVIYEGFAGDTPEKIRRRNPKFEEAVCSRKHVAD